MATNANDAAGNPDGDPYTNLEEYNAGQDPWVAEPPGMPQSVSDAFVLAMADAVIDADGDGIADQWEIAHGLDTNTDDSLLDPDGDGLTNLEEYNGGWHPQSPELPMLSQFSSLNAVIDTGACPYGFATDTDGDGMPDWWEVKYLLNPYLNDAAGNPDGDALCNVEEYNAGSNPRAFDFLLIDAGYGNLFVLDTGGKYVDTDGDGIPDWWERRFSGHGTNLQPTADADMDGLSNLDEYIAGCNPTNGCSVFCVSEVQTLGPAAVDGWILTWQTAPDRLYSVFSHTDLLTPWPTGAIYRVEGDGTPKSYTNTTRSITPTFFRIGVELITP